MKASIFTFVLCLFSGLAASLAVPAAEPKAGAIEARAITATLNPSLIIPLFEDSPNTAFGSYDYAEVSRSNGAHNVESLLAYTFNVGYPGKDCTFAFSYPLQATGSRKVQLFTVLGSITTSNTFSSRPSRNNFLGTFNAILNTVGTFDPPTPVFPCPASATTLGFEVVAEGDNDFVTWSKYTNGLVLQVMG